MVRLATALFIAFIICNARTCFAQTPDLNTMLEYLNSLNQNLTTERADLTTSQTSFQNNVTNQKEDINAFASALVQSYQSEVADVLATAPPNVDAGKICLPNDTAFLQSVQTRLTAGFACISNVSNVGNAQYANPISQNIAIQPKVTGLIDDLENCMKLPVVLCGSSLQTRFAALLSELGLPGPTPTVVLNDFEIGLQSLLDDCFDPATSFQLSEALQAADIALLTECVEKLQSP